MGDTVFVHGGVLPEHVAYGIDRINDAAQAWLRGEAELPPVLSGSESPQWTRLYSSDPDSAACGVLEEALGAMRAKRMIMGHSRQPGIASACGERAWRIDVGMASYYGGSVEVLEIVGDRQARQRLVQQGGRSGHRQESMSVLTFTSKRGK